MAVGLHDSCVYHGRQDRLLANMLTMDWHLLRPQTPTKLTHHSSFFWPALLGMCSTSTIEACDSARNLGVQFDCEMSMRAQIAKTTQICFFHLRRLRQVHRLLGRQVAAQLVSAFIISRLDYGNATLSGLPQSTLAPLQRVLNAAARLVCDLRPCTRTCDQCTDRFILASYCCTYRIQDMHASVQVVEQYCTSVHFRHAAASVFTPTSN